MIDNLDDTTRRGREGRPDATPSQTLAVTLDAWVRRDWNDGIQIDACPALECIVVQTHNSLYELIVLAGGGGEVLVRGGRFFPEFSRARLAGSTAGGSALKLMGIYVGLRMELHVERKSIVTSTVRGVSRREGPSPSM